MKPILRERCYACHGALKQESGLRVDSGEFLRQGGDAGPSIVSGRSAESRLIERITAEDPGERMPPEGRRLSVDEVQQLRRWIDQGATVPSDDKPDPDPRAHWAFSAPMSPPIPNLPADTDPQWMTGNPLDALIVAKQQRLRLTAAPRAERSILLRRVYLDLIGLPPTVVELDAFERDQRPDAYERVINDLLERPEYGEHWARHWMDIWRYTDWYGLGDQLRNSQKHLWHWRDWIVDSLNDDRSYAKMVQEMLAGDELAPQDPRALAATGFLARNYYLFNRTTWLDDTIEHTSKAFLGLTVNCCKCHDHKYDPMTQQDYYALRAIFEPHQVRLDALPGTLDLERDGLPRVYDAHPDVVTHVHLKGDPNRPDTSQAVVPQVPKFLRSAAFHVEARDLPLTVARPELNDWFWRDQLQAAVTAVQETSAALQALRAEPTPTGVDAQKRLEARPWELARLVKQLEAQSLRIPWLLTTEAWWRSEATQASGTMAAQAPPGAAATSSAPGAVPAGSSEADVKSTAEQALAAANVSAKAYEVALTELDLAAARVRALTDASAQEDLKRLTSKLESQRAAPADGTALRRALRATRKAWEGPDETEESRTALYPHVTTGRRLALARWLTDRGNPLTARVAVNHLWLRHFGQPLVASVDDFGRRCPAPVQQDVLDWLAVYLMDHDWQMKPLHRLIVSSRAYQSATLDRSTTALGQADPENAYYAYRRPHRMESQMVRDSVLELSGQLQHRLGGPTVDPRRDEAPYRRGLYFTHSRDDQHELLSMFDDADILRCYRRQETVLPQQALALVNSRLCLEASHRIAVQLADESSDDVFIDTAFRAVLSRHASPAEIEVSRAALERWRKQLPHLEGQASPVRERLIHVLLNHNDFVTIR